MSNRCYSCNKFVTKEMNEPEIEGEQIDDDGNITADVRLVLVCSDCGTELAESTQQVEIDGAEFHKCEPQKCVECNGEGVQECNTCNGATTVTSPDDDFDYVVCPACGGSGTMDCEHCEGSGEEPDPPYSSRYEINDSEAESYDDYGGTDRKGRPITNPRFQTHYFGANVTFDVTCNVCGESFKAEGQVQEAVSAFDDLQ